MALARFWLCASGPPAESMWKMIVFTPEPTARSICRSINASSTGSILPSTLIISARGLSPAVTSSRRASRGRL